MPYIKPSPKEELKIETTNYTEQHNPEYRNKMLFRYKYLFTKPENEMNKIELGLKFYLEIEGYDCLLTGKYYEDAIQIRRMKSLENNCDAILQRKGIPYLLINNYALIEKSKDRTISIKKNYTEEEKDVYV